MNNYTPRARLFEHLLQLWVSCFLRSSHQATARNNGYNHRNLKYRTMDTYVACVASVSSRVRRESWDESKKREMTGEGEGILLPTFRRCFADKNKLNLHDGQFKQWRFFLRWIARLHITFLWPWKGNLRGIGNWRLRLMNEIGKNNLLFCIYFRSLFQPEMDLKWVISEEERTRHDALFYSQKPPPSTFCFFFAPALTFLQ